MLGKRKPEVPLNRNEPEKAVRIMEKKAPALRDKELNPKFFPKRVSGEVEAVAPCRFVKSSDETDVGLKSKEGFQTVDRGTAGSSIRREFADINDGSQRETIQRQLLQLERQQAQLMNMLQDFMDRSHDGIITLENRVCGVERVVKDMAHDLSILANNQRGGNNMMESSGPLGNDSSKSVKNDDPMRGREDNGPARVAVIEEEDEEPGWMKWGKTLDALHADDVDMAFAIVLAAEDDVMLAELMERTGPVIYRLSSDVGAEVLEAVGRLVVDEKVFDICLPWLQELVETVKGGIEHVEMSMEVKREILVNLSSIEPSKVGRSGHGVGPGRARPRRKRHLGWESMVPVLASAWDIDLQELQK